MVVVYSRPQCGPCQTLKYFLNKRGVSYEEREPDETVWIVPTVVVGAERIEGLNFARLSELLALQTA